MTRRMILLLLSLALTGVTWTNPKDDEDEYTRLARLSYIEGSVSYQHATDVDWAAASINLPLEPGDRIYTSQDGRAEIEFDDGSVYRLARNTDIEILSLRDDLIQLRVLVGLSTLVVASDTDFEINTPAAAFNTLQKGIYRFNVEDNGDSDAIVRKGKLEAANNDFSRRVESGNRIYIALGRSGNPEFAQYSRRDEWDEWNDRRNADLNAYGSRKYLPDTVYVGVSDLHRNGRWVEVDYYGSAWVPYSVGVSWSPYSVGRWCYRPIFGWTWVSYEPWGWLPYHYGRWYHSPSYGWCWLPGSAFTFNFWSPGLVAFYSGPGWVSWCPLGPGDYYNVHQYHFRRGIYGHQLNQLAHLNTRQMGHLFNRDAPHAFRTAPLDGFRNGSFRDRDRERNWANVDQPWKRGELVRDSLSIRPTSTSYRAAPDRQAARPIRERALPAVVRSSPAYNSRSQDHLTRITNPQIPSIPSRAERMKSAREESNSSVGGKPSGRVMQTPPRERENLRVQTPQSGREPQADQNPSAGGTMEQNGRRMTTRRWTRTNDDKGDNSRANENSPSGSRPDAAPPADRRAAPQGRSEQASPAQRQINRNPSENKSDKGDRPQSKPADPRSRSNGNSRSESSAITTPPRTNSARTYYSYRPSNPSSEQGNTMRSYSDRTYSAPSSNRKAESRPTTVERSSPSIAGDSGARSFSTRSYSAPSYSAPSNSRNSGAGSMSFGRSSPASTPNSGSRSFSAPSFNRSGGSSPSQSGGFSGGGSFSRSPGAGMQRAQERSSSGGGRGKR